MYDKNHNHVNDRWDVSDLSEKIQQHTLKLGPDFELRVDCCHDGHLEIASAVASLYCKKLQTDVMTAVVLNGSEGFPNAERTIRARIAAINKSRHWYKEIHRCIKTLRIPLDRAEP